MMNSVTFQSVAPSSWISLLSPSGPASSSFWERANVCDRLRDLQNTVNLAKAMKKELEMLLTIKYADGSMKDTDDDSTDASISRFSRFLEINKISLASQESCSIEAAKSLISKLRFQLEPFELVMDETSPWEKKSAVVRLANKIQKSKRNKLWRKRKRRQLAEMQAKERQQFDKADQEADEWRAKEIAKGIAKRKVEKMKEIAKLKAKEVRKRLESEAELVLVVEKLQELRTLRIEKLKKQGHFLPEEDDKFLQRVRVAVEEEERQVMAAADTEATKDAIATAEESRKAIQAQELDPASACGEIQLQKPAIESEKNATLVSDHDSGKQAHVEGYSRSYESLTSLPLEFYHYYHGSNTDMGTLIEVRRTWDAYIRPGGSRIPGHWVQPPPPADTVWASYMVKPK